MKKLNFKCLKVFTILFLILPFCFMLTACGTQGLQGLSAYELALENGFVGTEQEWLASLRGKSAYELALENGFVGTEQEWIASLQGKNGEDGSSSSSIDTYEMYKSAKENGEFEDENYSYLDFLKDYFENSSNYTSAYITKNLYSVVSVYAYISKYSPNHSAAGSGIIYSISSDGDAYIITNYHVAYNSTTKNPNPYYKLYLYGQDDVPIIATYYGGIRSYDIAILKVEGSEVLKNSNAQAVTFSESNVSLGQTCYAIGDTSEYGLTVTQGIISVESEIISMKIGGISSYFREIRHDCYIFHGNSGGGLFDTNGNLIGLTNGGREDTLINYAIPINIVKSITENIIQNANENNTTIKVYQTGIENNLTASQTLSIYDSSTSKIIIKEKVVISKIDENSLLANSNLQTNDEIISITYNGASYENLLSYTLKTYTLKELLLASECGDVIKFEALRTKEDGTTETVYEEIVLNEAHFEFIN